jgi:hypothetical protein
MRPVQKEELICRLLQIGSKHELRESWEVAPRKGVIVYLGSVTVGCETLVDSLK